MPILEDRRRTVADIDDKLAANSVTSPSNDFRDRVEVLSSKRRTSFEPDRTVIASHKEQLVRAKFKQIEIQSHAFTTYPQKRLINVCRNCGERVDNTPPSPAPLPPQLILIFIVVVSASVGLWKTVETREKEANEPRRCAALPPGRAGAPVYAHTRAVATRRGLAGGRGPERQKKAPGAAWGSGKHDGRGRVVLV